jgi:hypothetical protein
VRLQCCGGQGFLSENKIGTLLNDMNVDVTFEGDNTVMMQQVRVTMIVQVLPAMLAMQHGMGG